MTNRFLFIAVVAAILGSSSALFPAHDSPELEQQTFSFRRQQLREEAPPPESFDNVRNLMRGDRPMLALFREDVTHQAVVDFFVELTGSSEIAMPILYHAERADLPLSLVFSLAWVESRYSPVAINENATSIDRGLFQLNSLTFRDLSEDDFFHPDVNTYHGMQYLTWCMEHTETEMQGVACYNAGLTRVRAGRTPSSTLRYMDIIREFRAQLEARFQAYIADEFPSSST
jgi:soluble lytic murein transglycosylase-like protein